VPDREPAPLPDTTDREREVLRLIACGLANAEVAEALHISLSTTKTYIGRLLTKLGARDRAQLVILAYQAGLVHA
jgi:DNA-binding NarL/FixJ family response regulator